MTQSQLSDKVNSLRQMLNNSRTWVLVTHMHPDGDAIGSTLGFRLILQALGKKATVIVPDAAPDNLSFLEGYSDIVVADQNEMVAKQLFLEADGIAFLDFNIGSRCGIISQWIDESKAAKVMVDHHPYPDFEGVLQISDVACSSTCELVTQVVVELNLLHVMSIDAASCFYTGILTDTGGFSHNSSRPELFRIVADLLDKGLDKDFIHNEVLHQQSASRMKLMGYCLSEKLLIVDEFQVAIISLTKEELDRFDFKKGDTEGFVNLPLSIKGVVLSVLIMEREGATRMSFRSKGDFPANKVSSDHFEGGGHFNAAGGISKLSVAETVEKLLTVLPQYKSYLPS